MSTQWFTDRPKLFADPAACAARTKQLREPHIAPLTVFVGALRAQVGPDLSIPNFDPWDGGIDADILYLLEAPASNVFRAGSFRPTTKRRLPEIYLGRTPKATVA